MSSVKSRLSDASQCSVSLPLHALPQNTLASYVGCSLTGFKLALFIVIALVWVGGGVNERYLPLGAR